MSRSWAGKRRQQLRVVCIKVMVKGTREDESAERGSVHNEQQRTENGALETTTGGGTQGRECVITSNTVGAR